ncbi:MAG TPA: class II aldolase [Ruminiclostridium sp.]|nr:class II aldolase [Ruminiclostridium sp.]
MVNEILKDLEYISKSVGIPVDYTQGGGGNTSAKLDDNLMAVKASGYKLKQITPQEGYVVVNYQNIKAFYEAVDLSQDRDFEKESVEFVKKNIVETEGLKTLRPSVEAGFHSILKKYVIHTHSVYANMVCCTQNGRETMEKIFAGKEYGVVWIPYINPGFCLTLRIQDEIRKFAAEKGKYPEVIFMENHGLVVTTDDSRECVALHQEVNDGIKAYLGIREKFPDIVLSQLDDGTFISKTALLSDYFKNHKMYTGFFDEIVLYPDQLVYLNGNAAVDTMDKKLNINSATGQITYKTNFSEAQTMEETLLAYIYVINGIKSSGLPLKTMSEKEIDFIKNWESEAYRKSLVKGLGR